MAWTSNGIGDVAIQCYIKVEERREIGRPPMSRSDIKTFRKGDDLIYWGDAVDVLADYIADAPLS